jgi:2-C-methyl-D-erythritol 2,4-cyclodiphosphate synthase
VLIPFEKGLQGHSDADVLAHAVADALLGAAALGDIGFHFPDSDERFFGLSGAELLARTSSILETPALQFPLLMLHFPANNRKYPRIGRRCARGWPVLWVSQKPM